MERNNIEKQIQEKLRNREIQPSLKAWDRLDAMLTVQEEKKEKKSFAWVKIAAVLTLFTGLGFWIFTSNSSEISLENANTTVVENSEKPKKAMPTNLSEKEAILESEMQAGMQAESQKQVVASVSSSTSVDNKTKTKNVKMSNSITNSKKVEELEKTEELVYVEEKQPIITPKVKEKEVIVAIEQQEPKAKLKINPNALLEQVEEEEVLTFRQKVMKTINKNYKNAKESFASRNQQ